MNHVKDRLRELTQPTGEEDLLAVEYPRPRVRIAPWQAAVIAVVVVGIVIAWMGISARSTPTLPEAAPVEPTPASLVVSVVGQVQHPGLVTLPADARVADALDSAQPLPGADTASLNLAQKLADGQQVHLAPPASPGEPGASSGEEPGISLNSASAEELTELSGVGEVTAAAIVAYREENGGFSSIEQLEEVSGIGPAKFAQIKDQVHL